jgi:L-asparaginase/Glu-tRNA(Gln) amidotransferase subunit D
MSLNFTHIKGDTFDEVNFEIKKDNVAINLTGATIKMQLRKNATDVSPALSLTSASSAGITITAATLGKFKINQQIINIEVANYQYDIEITLSSGVVKTYISGGFNITQEITR